MDYSGGDLIIVSRLLGARGPDVVCCGDHLFGDVVGHAQEAVRVAHHAGGPVDKVGEVMLCTIYI